MTAIITTPYTEHLVWDDESGERCFIYGHVKPERRAIAAANHWARGTCGMINLADDKDAELRWFTVDYRWNRPDPKYLGDDESGAWCDESHPEARAITVVSW